MTNPVNITGYLRDSPHRHNDFNLIKSKNITMNNVDIPLLLRPNKGKSLIAMPNSGEYKFPKADFVTEIPLAKYQTGSPECPRGYIWDNVIQQCVPAPQDGAINPNQRIISAPASKANFDQITGQNTTDQNNNVNETQEMRLKRMFGKPNIPAILGTNLLAFGLSAFSNNVEEGRQRGFAMNQINNPLFNQTYSNAQNDYGVDPYEQTGQLRKQYQQGGTVDPLSQQKAFYNLYMNSPKYLERLNKQGYSNPEQVIKDRLANVNATKENRTSEFNASAYRAANQDILMDPSFNKANNLDEDTVRTHEMGHAGGALSRQYDNIPTDVMLNQNDVNLLAAKNQSFNSHDRMPSEMKADMDTLRYMMKKDGTYDAGTQDFDKNHYKQAKQKYSSDPVIGRLFQNTGTNDLITLMNTVAQAPDPKERAGGNFMQQGGRIPIQVTNPNDPRLRAYNDSLAAYNRYGNLPESFISGKNKYLKQEEVQPMRNSLKQAIDNPLSTEKPFYLNHLPNINGKKQVIDVPFFTKPVQPVVYQKPQSKEYSINQTADPKDLKKFKEFMKHPGGNLTQDEFTERERLFKKYKVPSTTTKNQYGLDDTNWTLTDEFIKKFQPQPKVEKAPIIKPVINPRFKGKDTTQMGTNPIPSDNPAITAKPYDFTNPTPFSFTQADGQYLHQATTYFPSESALRMYSKDKRAVSIQASKNGATATGYQRGGKFNAYEYLYGDDEETQDTPKPADVPKRKRIVEDQIDTTDDQDAMDIANMDSPVRSQRTRQNAYTSDSAYTQDSSEASNYALMYLKHQQGAAGIEAIKKAASQGLDAVPRNWNKENIQANMKNNIGKDFQGPLIPANFLNYWAGKVNRHMQIASNKQTPYDNIFNQIGQQEGVNPIFLKAVANMESGLNPNNNTGSKYKGLFAQNANTFKGNIFDPVQATKAAAKNFKKFEQGGEFSVDFETLKELQKRGIKFNIL